jgi:hypothetical protein
MSPALSIEACVRAEKLLEAEASPAKILPTNSLRFMKASNPKIDLRESYCSWSWKSSRLWHIPNPHGVAERQPKAAPTDVVVESRCACLNVFIS